MTTIVQNSNGTSSALLGRFWRTVIVIYEWRINRINTKEKRVYVKAVRLNLETKDKSKGWNIHSIKEISYGMDFDEFGQYSGGN